MAQPLPASIPAPLKAMPIIQTSEAIKRKPLNGHASSEGDIAAQTRSEKHSEVSNGTANPPTPRAKSSSRYHHIFAVHSEIRTSCLSHDSAASPSFLGFRNLMVIVLSEFLRTSPSPSPSHPSLRLIPDGPFLRCYSHLLTINFFQSCDEPSFGY